MRQIFVKNNADSQLAAGLPSGATTAVLAAGTGNAFPAPVEGEFFLVSLFERDEQGLEANFEVVKVTQRVADTLTIERDVENMTGEAGGISYPTVPGRVTFVSLRLTAASADGFSQRRANLSDLDDIAQARTNLGLGDVDNVSAAQLRDRATHTGVQAISTVTGLQTALDAKAPLSHVGSGGSQHAAATTALAGFMSAADKAKLDGVAAGATANATNAQLRDRATHTGMQAISTVTGLQDALEARVLASRIGQASGVAPLDAGGKVPAAHLPSYVDDVLEFDTLTSFPATGEAGKIYVAQDTSRIYRWSGSAYVEISPSPGSTDAVPEGSSNQYFTQARVRATPLTGLSTGTNSPVVGSDTVLQAAGKLQAQVSNRALLEHTHTASEISDATATGRAVLTAADEAAAREAIGAQAETPAMTEAEAEAGTLTESRLIAPSVLAAAIAAATPDVSGKLDAVSGTATGMKFTVQALGALSGAVALDLSAATEFTGTVSGDTTISFSNPPATSEAQVVYLRLTNAGAFTITWPANTKFDAKTAPTLTAAGVDLLGVKYDAVTSTYMVFVIGLDVGVPA